MTMSAMDESIARYNRAPRHSVDRDRLRDEHRRIARHLSGLASTSAPSVEDSVSAIEMVVAHLGAHRAVQSAGPSSIAEDGGAVASRLRRLLLQLAGLICLGTTHTEPVLVELEEVFRRHVTLEEACV